MTFILKNFQDKRLITQAIEENQIEFFKCYARTKERRFAAEPECFLGKKRHSPARL